MASFKRKRDEYEDSEDDEEPSFGRQILPVANLPEDFAGEPMDGMQYLFTVRRDARCLPHITRVTNPYEPKTPLPSQTDYRVIPKHIALPSEEWRTIFETRLKNFRKASPLTRASTNVKQPTIDVPFTPMDNSQRVLPDKKERDFWWGFFAGKPESDWNPRKQPKQPKQNAANAAMRRLSALIPTESISSVRTLQESWQTNDEGEVELVLRIDSSDSLPTPADSPAPPEFGEQGPISLAAPDTIIYKPREPVQSLLRHIDERTALHLLMYFTHWINNHVQRPDSSSRPIESHARWIFALLSKVDDHISADDMNLLRTLARACLALLKDLVRSREKPQSLDGNNGGYMSVRSCWIIISTVAGVWAQRDLWLDAEDMLKGLGQPEL